MERRPFLALLTTTIAGCSATGPSTPTEAPTEAPTATPAATDTATSTPSDTSTPTDTPTATPTPAETAIDEVRSTLTAVLAQYRGTGETILATDASTTGFDDRHVDLGVAEAERELKRARELARTDEQERTIGRLETVRQFLEAAAETQVALVGAYRRLENARTALAAENATAAKQSLRAMEIQRQIAHAPYTTVVEETDAEATAALPGLDASTYRAKCTQFEAEMNAFGRVSDPVGEFADAVSQLEAAVALRRNDSSGRAEAVAERAAERLDVASASLASMAENLATPADSLVDVSRTLSDLAATKAASARERFGLDESGGAATATETGSGN